MYGAVYLFHCGIKILRNPATSEPFLCCESNYLAYFRTAVGHFHLAVTYSAAFNA